MSKIIQAVNSIISNPHLIGKVLFGSNNELFFTYKNKYKWSIRRQDDGNYSLWFYPSEMTIEELAAIENEEWEHVPMMHYSTKDLATKEALASFEELYRITKEKVFEMDQVLDDIIKDMDDLPF